MSSHFRLKLNLFSRLLLASNLFRKDALISVDLRATSILSGYRPAFCFMILGGHTNTTCLLIHAALFTSRLRNLIFRVDIPFFPLNVRTLVPLFTGVVPLYFSRKRVTGGQVLARVGTVPLFQSCKSAFCFRFFYVAAVKQKLACSEEIFTKESLFSVTLTAKARTRC